ncbi:hypothetical protein B0H17DRAFT_1083084 [Mycena rosella]|uniref:SMODS and SLOG-associating 2TM effector domain-containing protein n=1 Tax=Mycena rosella TaxID=1033263 RepID=A0AAD7D0T4_MYCRO|nr:hypothetical protein B0H17DRAFT_1083084 [Mycena rosella]
MAAERNEDLPTLPGTPAIYARGASPRPESPRPASGSLDEAPPDEAHTRPLRDASLPRLPAEAAILHPPGRRRSEVDWIVPVDPKREPRPKTVQERIWPTLETAIVERSKYELKARMTGYALNIAIGLQVVLGALTTGLSALTTGRQTSIVTSILGAFRATGTSRRHLHHVASYLARARGSNEPELSIARSKDLDQYIRECETFVLDFGHITGDEHDGRLNALRQRFENLLGNANGERRMAPG